MPKQAEVEDAGKVTFRLPAALVRRAKHYAVDADQSLQEVMAEALATFLDMKDKKRNGRPTGTVPVTPPTTIRPVR